MEQRFSFRSPLMADWSSDSSSEEFSLGTRDQGYGRTVLFVCPMHNLTKLEIPCRACCSGNL